MDHSRVRTQSADALVALLALLTAFPKPGGRAAARRMLWLGLAVWRTVTLGAPQLAVLWLFRVLDLAVVSRVVFPAGRTA